VHHAHHVTSGCAHGSVDSWCSSSTHQFYTSYLLCILLLLLYLISLSTLLEWFLHLQRTGLLIPNFSLVFNYFFSVHELMLVPEPSFNSICRSDNLSFVIFRWVVLELYNLIFFSLVVLCPVFFEFKSCAELSLLNSPMSDVSGTTVSSSDKKSSVFSSSRTKSLEHSNTTGVGGTELSILALVSATEERNSGSLFSASFLVLISVSAVDWTVSGWLLWDLPEFWARTSWTFCRRYRTLLTTGRLVSNSL